MQTVHQIDRLGRILNTFHFTKSELKAAVKLSDRVTDEGYLAFDGDPLYLKIEGYTPEALALEKFIVVECDPVVATRVGKLVDQFVVVHWLDEYGFVQDVDVMCRSELYSGFVTLSADDKQVAWRENPEDEPTWAKLYDLSGAQLTFARAGLVVPGNLVCL